MSQDLKTKIRVNNGDECYDLIDEYTNLDHDGDKAKELIAKVYDARYAELIAMLLNRLYRNKVYASTGAERCKDGMNVVVSVTAHCKCGNVFCDDIKAGLSKEEL
jgi:hypothetical protein